jgi:hypothetical protein
MRDFLTSLRSRWLPGWNGPSTVVALVLVLTLVVTAVLAYQAQDAARSHRVTAENVLRDYAAFASSELARRARRELPEVLGAQLRRLSTACDGAGQLPDFEQWVRAKDS